MTLHGRDRLVCHHCGAERPAPARCTKCGSQAFGVVGQGTERIEEALAALFPEAGVARVDRDSTRRKGSMERLLDEVQRGTRRLLVGTQMLAKGHDFPNVTLVGVLDADQGLFSADFRASERMAQLITQVAGRAGRAERPGEVLIQTHQPDHPLLRHLVREGYGSFASPLWKNAGWHCSRPTRPSRCCGRKRRERPRPRHSWMPPGNSWHSAWAPNPR